MALVRVIIVAMLALGLTALLAVQWHALIRLVRTNWSGGPDSIAVPAQKRSLGGILYLFALVVAIVASFVVGAALGGPRVGLTWMLAVSTVGLVVLGVVVIVHEARSHPSTTPDDPPARTGLR